MKIQNTLFTAIAAAALVITGCSKEQVKTTVDDAKAAVANIDTSKVESAFASADADTKQALDPVIAAVKGADYSGAVTQLKSFGEKFKLTDEQKAAVDDLIAKAQQAIKDAASKAAGDASKAAADMSKSLGK
jgi:PBP1b-binding outer membrane lipoprotein LpoB